MVNRIGGAKRGRMSLLIVNMSVSFIVRLFGFDREGGDFGWEDGDCGIIAWNVWDVGFDAGADESGGNGGFIILIGSDCVLNATVM